MAVVATESEAEFEVVAEDQLPQNHDDSDEDPVGAIGYDSRDAFIGDVFDELLPVDFKAPIDKEAAVAKIPVLDEAMARLPEALVSAMRERLRAEFRTVTSWQAPVKR